MDLTQISAIVCLLLTALLGIAWIFIKAARPKLSTAMVVVLFVYVASGFYGLAVDKGRAKTQPVIQADQSEVALRLSSAIADTERMFGEKTRSTGSRPHGSSPADSFSKKKVGEFMKEARNTLDKGLAMDPHNSILSARRVILTHEMGEPITSALKELEQTTTSEGPALAQDLSFIYGPPSKDMAKAKVVEEDIMRRLPAGWYQIHAIESLLRTTQQTARLDEMLDDQAQKNAGLLIRFGIIVVVVCTMGLVGIITLIVQLMFVSRNMTSQAELPLVQAPAAYGFKTVLGVFLCWLAAELTFSTLASGAIRSLKLLQHGVLVAALSTALLYIVSNGPGPLFAYLLAMKPHGVKFLEGIKLRFRCGDRGPRKMILTGVLAYFSCIPLVLAAYAIGFTFYKTQGSSNPIIALVMEAARSSNIVATVVFYFTVGVLAPLCEESLFRGFLYSSLRRKLSIAPSILISALLFAAAHMDPGGFIALATLGAVFAFLTEKTKSILPGMIAHGLWNSGTFSLVLMLFGN